MIPEGAIVASSALTNNKHAADGQIKVSMVNYHKMKVITHLCAK
jgi:hypothetical protein